MKKRPFEKSLIINLSLALMSGIFTLFTVEAILHIVENFNDIENSQNHIDHGNFYLSPPNTMVENVNENGYTIYFMTDEFGLRNSIDVYQNPNKKILILGDSFVEAANTPNSQMLTTILQQNLDKVKPQSFVVINAGVGGYSNAQSVFLLNYAQQKIKPSIVILMIYLGNDLHDNYFLSPFAKIELENLQTNKLSDTISNENINALSTNNFVTKLKQIGRQSKILTLIYSFFIGNQTQWADNFLFEMETYRNSPVPTVRTAIVNTEEIFRQMSNFCQSHHIKCILVGIPSKAQVYEEFSFIAMIESSEDNIDHVLRIIRDKNGYSFDNPSKIYSKIADRVNLPYYDLTPLFRQHASENLYYKIDRHWTAKGQEIAANYLVQILAELCEK